MTQRRRRNATAFYAVDRLEGSIVILIGDDGTTHEVLRASLPKPTGEGVVLRVPLDASGRPRWAAATADPGERRRRLDEAERRLEELRKRDPGGDVVL